MSSKYLQMYASMFYRKKLTKNCLLYVPQETGVGLLGDVEQAAVALGRDASIEEDHVQVARLRLDAGVDKVLKRLF